MPIFRKNALQAPAALGPYSHSTIAGGFAFISGQAGIDPATNALVPGGIEPETKQVLANILSVLAELGLSPADVVKTTVFLRDMKDFAAMNAIYGETFGAAPPARSTVQVSGLPKNANVEIEAIAAAREAK
jgi:2-iminobutanoate/2-iminopropanoate deaminase